MKRIVYCLFVLTLRLNVDAKVLSNQEIVDKYLPSEILQTKDTDEDPPVLITRDLVVRQFIEYDFGSRDGTRYILATYSNKNIPVDKPMAIFLVIKVMRNGVSSILPAPTNGYGIDEKSELNLHDLDGDGIKELVVTNYNIKQDFWDSKIFKWSKTKLENITSSITNNGSTLLSQLQLNALPMLIFTQSVPAKDDAPAAFFQRAKQFSPSGELVDLGTFDFITVISKESKKVEEKTYPISIVQDGSYTLVVKNLSKHARAVRAEIWVNDVVVLKPADFCHGKPNPFVKQKDKKGNDLSEDDDDDDGDEDRCKRCDPKKDIYATVNMKPEGNVIKVKLYGNKNSKIQITLKKK